MAVIDDPVIAKVYAEKVARANREMRVQFAGHVLAAIVLRHGSAPHDAADLAIQYADALIARLDKPSDGSIS